MTRPVGESAARRLHEGAEDPRGLLLEYRATGDGDARERLIEQHMPLVRALARRHARGGERFEDLVQVGCIGLIEAIDRFDPDRGDDFARFAIPTISGEIRHHLRDRSELIRAPRRLAELRPALRFSRESLTRRVARAPTTSELAREAGLCEEEVAEAIEMELVCSPLSLSAAYDDPGLEAAVAVDSTYEASDDRLLLAAAFRTLGARERRILHLRFFAGLSQREIAREVGLSQVQVSRLIRSSLERMRPVLAGS